MFNTSLSCKGCIEAAARMRTSQDLTRFSSYVMRVYALGVIEVDYSTTSTIFDHAERAVRGATIRGGRSLPAPSAERPPHAHSELASLGLERLGYTCHKAIETIHSSDDASRPPFSRSGLRPIDNTLWMHGGGPGLFWRLLSGRAL